MTRPPIDQSAPGRIAESELNRFSVRDKTSIQRILSDLARHNRQTTIYYNSGEDFLLSAVIGYNPNAAELYLDCAADEETNQRLLLAERRVAVSAHNRVPVRFTIAQVAISELHREPAFLVPEPRTIIRMQRREFFRVATPVADPLVCRFSAADGSSFEAAVVDISLGGMALLEQPAIPAKALAIGQQIPSCRIELPGQGLIETSFEVRNVYSSVTRLQKLQIGCQFHRLDARMTARLQRYIHKLELGRRRIIEPS